MNRRILVTGAAGFIGSHVTQALLTRGDQVVGLDNLNDYYAPERKEANLREVIDAVSPGERFQFIKADFRDRAMLQGLFERQTFEAVVHLGAMAGVRASVEDPHLYLDVNLVGTLNLLEAARRHRVGNFVFASTSSAHGNTRCLLMVPSWSFLTHGLASIHTDWTHGLEPWAVSGLGLRWQAAPGPGS
jgi:UDP-glucuronate 4-epimerase